MSLLWGRAQTGTLFEMPSTPQFFGPISQKDKSEINSIYWVSLLILG